MLEQETAGIIKFVLEAAGDPTPYYGNVPEGFAVPSAFFPSPDISYQPDSLSSYGADCCLYAQVLLLTAATDAVITIKR